MHNGLRWKRYPIGREGHKAEYAVTGGFVYIRVPFAVVLPKLELMTEGLPQPRLTKREAQVYKGILEAKANKEIAYDLNLSERTVKFHVSSLLTKFGVRSRTELMSSSGEGLVGRLVFGSSQPAVGQ